MAKQRAFSDSFNWHLCRIAWLHRIENNQYTHWLGTKSNSNNSMVTNSELASKVTRQEVLGIRASKILLPTRGSTAREDRHHVVSMAKESKNAWRHGKKLNRVCLKAPNSCPSYRSSYKWGMSSHSVYSPIYWSGKTWINGPLLL